MKELIGEAIGRAVGRDLNRLFLGFLRDPRVHPDLRQRIVDRVKEAGKAS